MGKVFNYIYVMIDPNGYYLLRKEIWVVVLIILWKQKFNSQQN